MSDNQRVITFSFAEYWPFYAGFVALILALLALDLGVFHKKTRAFKFREAAIWSAIWVSLALLFNLLFYYYVLHSFEDPALAKRLALEFLTGYLVEKSLAVDNIFIFAIVFAYFGIPQMYQHRILFFGIIGALIFRALFIALGAVLMQYHAVVIIFGVFLIFTGIKLVWGAEKEIAPENNILVRLVKKIIPVSEKIENQAFFIKKSNIWHATPLFIALVFLEFTDIIFAIDSVPAIFALTKEPFIVFTSNIFAILGLRSMYFMMAGFMDRFEYLRYGLAGVLVFVGLKMSWLNEAFGGKFPVVWSLAIIALLIGGSMVISLILTKRKANSDLSRPAP